MIYGGLGIIGRFLMQAFNGGHFAPFLGDLQAIGDHDHEPIDGNRLKNAYGQSEPHGAECFDIQGV